MDFSSFSLDTLQKMLSTDYLQGMGAIITIPILLYLAETFFGYRLFRIKCAITGFTFGFSVGLMIANALKFTVEWQNVLCGAVLGLIAAFFAVKYYKFGVFLTNAASGFVFGLAIGGLPAALIAAILVGTVAVFLTKPCIIVTTAFTGGMGLAECIVAMSKIASTWATAIGIGICAVGILIQLKTTKGV